MIYITGDIHGSPEPIFAMQYHFQFQKEDIVILLGDVGANYDLGHRDRALKRNLTTFPPTYFCIHGNHECRPQNIPTYQEKEWNGGIVLYEEQYPNILFPVDGEIFTLGGKQCIVIGGAYSVDKAWRLNNHHNWWEDEQPSETIKARVEQQLKTHTIDIVFSHTCPFSYEPQEMFLPYLDQSTVDTSTERWLDQIEQNLDYQAWYCGHWHTNKRVDRMHFLYHDVETLEELNDKEKR